MSLFRALIKLLLFLFITSYYYTKIVAGNLLAPLGVDKFQCSSNARNKWGKAIVRLLGINIKVHGTPPEPPFFLVSNHLSYIDVWVLFAQLKCTFIAKSDVKSWPVIGFVLNTSGMIFVDREKRSDVQRVNEEISERLNSHQGIVLFPEGTTSSGADILSFKTPLFQYPAENELEVSCAALSYKTPRDKLLAHKQICWWDDTPFFTHFINMLKMKEFSATITFSDEKIVNTNRKLLAGTAQGIVQQSFEPVIQPDEHAKASVGS